MSTEYNSLIQSFSDATGDGIERLDAAQQFGESDIPENPSLITTPNASSRRLVSRSPGSSSSNFGAVEEKTSSKNTTDLSPETRGLLTTDENSVIRCVGLASGLHLVTSGEKVDDSLR
jgi:hypothetical protein